MRTEDIRKNQATDALMKLRSFLDTKEPELVYWLQHIWRQQQRAITYKELREAIMSGVLSQQLIEDWQQDYSKFVVAYLLPAYREAMVEAAKELSARYPMFLFNPAADGVVEWTTMRAAHFVTNVTTDQIKAIGTVVERASRLQDMTVDGLARAIRPMVGLTHGQAIANLNYYNKMIESGVSQKKALENSIKYSARQNRYRGYNIARTELAFAYNKGQHLGVVQAQEEGYMGHMKKVWCTADDERVCETCGGLDGTTIEMDEHFDFKTKLKRRQPDITLTPPAHPSCRCTVIYEEVEPPKF